MAQIHKTYVILYSNYINLNALDALENINVPKDKKRIINNIKPIIKKQKYERAKFFKFTFLVPPNEKTINKIKPTIGIANKISYPKYPHILIGFNSSGMF